MKSIGAYLALSVLVILTSSHLSAQNSIQPDRPGFGTGTYTIEPRSTYVELGYEFGFASGGQQPSYHQLPYTNIRYGLTQWLEVSIGWDGVQVSNGAEVMDGFGVGGKLRALQADDYNISVLGLLGFSHIAEGLSINPLLGFLWDYEITNNLGAFGVIQTGYEKSRDLYVEASFGLALAIGSRYSVYGEYYIENLQKFNDLGHNIDIGITYLLRDDIQIDAYYTTAFTNDAYRQLGVGIAKRF